MPVIALLLCLLAFTAQAEPHRRALLIGINDYSASHIAQRSRTQDRDWADLRGAINDVDAMREMLTLLYGFEPRDIVTLKDQSATRDAILNAISTHLGAASEGDIVFFYYAGHGSQVRNWRSDEPDRFDESIVPADSRRGAPDIRDKELRRLFNRILDRGARLTVILDDCNSGSGARGLFGSTSRRSVKPDLRDVADAANYGPRPEERGALVIAASQDFGEAGEALDDEDQQMRGVFSAAWLRAMRDADGEPAIETFLRVQARLRGSRPYQQPVLAGGPLARRTPFLGANARRSRSLIAVSKIRPDGTLELQGGWAHGLTRGSVLRVAGSPQIRITITALSGLGQSVARIEGGRVDPGTLLELDGWLAPSARSMRVWMSRMRTSEIPIAGLAKKLAIFAAHRRIQWIRDPTTKTPSHIIRFRDEQWELVAADGTSRRFTHADDALDGIPSGASLFVQLPAPATLADAMNIDSTPNPADADYILTGRYIAGKLTYAWVRPGVTQKDRRDCGLPVRSAWLAPNAIDDLRDTVHRLRRIAMWQALESPPQGRFPYRLALRHVHDGALVQSNTVTGGERYRLVLRASNPPPALSPRFIYVFVIDSNGRSVLLYPRASAGSVENRRPLDGTPPEIDDLPDFDVTAPYGVDTYFLLTSDEPLPNPTILEWSGVRSDLPHAPSALEQLLMETGAGRSPSVRTPATWSIERVAFESTSQKDAGRVSLKRRDERGSIRAVSRSSRRRSHRLRPQAGRCGRNRAGRDSRRDEARGGHCAWCGVGLFAIGGVQAGDQSRDTAEGVGSVR